MEKEENLDDQFFFFAAMRLQQKTNSKNTNVRRMLLCLVYYVLLVYCPPSFDIINIQHMYVYVYYPIVSRDIFFIRSNDIAERKIRIVYILNIFAAKLYRIYCDIFAGQGPRVSV